MNMKVVREKLIGCYLKPTALYKITDVGECGNGIAYLVAEDIHSGEVIVPIFDIIQRDLLYNHHPTELILKDGLGTHVEKYELVEPDSNDNDNTKQRRTSDE